MPQGRALVEYLMLAVSRAQKSASLYLDTPLFTRNMALSQGVTTHTGIVLHTFRCSASFLALHYVGMPQLRITGSMLRMEGYVDKR